MGMHGAACLYSVGLQDRQRVSPTREAERATRLPSWQPIMTKRLNSPELERPAEAVVARGAQMSRVREGALGSPARQTGKFLARVNNAAAGLIRSPSSLRPLE